MKDRDRVQALRVVAHPTARGAVVVVLLREWVGGRSRDRECARRVLDLGERLPLDEPGPLLMALSDALAATADSLRPQD